MNGKVKAIINLLFRIEAEMRALHLWSDRRPSARALNSDQPFAVDTLGFEQWLQFIFLERMHAMVEGHQLPSSCDIAPMAEEALPQRLKKREVLIELLREFDVLINQD